MPKIDTLNPTPRFEYFATCLRAIGERRYRDALTILGDGISKQLASGKEMDARELLKNLGTLITYLDFRLGEDFGTKWEAQPNHENQTEVRCSFCGKREPEVSRIIAGPGVFICDECVKAFDDILTKS